MRDNPKEKAIAANRAEASRRLAALERDRPVTTRSDEKRDPRAHAEERPRNLDHRLERRRDRELEAEQ